MVTRPKPGWSAACVPLILWACDDSPSPVAAPEPLHLAVVSGDHQRGQAGRELDEAFVVRATNGRGQGVGGVTVTWTIIPGEASFSDGTSRTTEGVFGGPSRPGTY